MKKRLIALSILSMGMLFASISWGQSHNLSLSTGSMGGGFYAIGGGMAEYLTKNVEGLRVTAVTSGGVDENIRGDIQK